MDELLFEDNLLESMEIISFEERDINEIIRENSHALLDAEMDMEEILYESNTYILTESSGENFFKRAFKKLKALWDKFIAWIKSIINKIKDIRNPDSNNNNKKSAIDDKINNYNNTKIMGNPVSDFDSLPAGRDKSYYAKNVILNYRWYDLYSMTKQFRNVHNKLISDSVNIENDNIGWYENIQSIKNEINDIEETNSKVMNLADVLIDENGEFKKLSDAININEINTTRNFLTQSEKSIEKKLWSITDGYTRNSYANIIIHVLATASNKLMSAYKQNIDVYNSARQTYLSQMHKYGYTK